LFRLAQKRDLKAFILSTIFFLGSFCLSAQIDPIFIADIPIEIEESSGLQKTDTDSYWTHNDTDDNPKIFNINENGDLLEELTLQGITPVDFEDVAYDGELFFYIGDFGNNLNDRTDLKIFRIPNPDLLDNFVNPELISFTLSDQVNFPPVESNLNFDIEAMFYFDGNLHLFTKNRTNPFDGIIKHYRLSPNPGNHVAELVNSHFGNLSPIHASITAADINGIGSRVALLTNSSVFIFSNFTGDDFFSGDLSYNFFNSTATREGISFKDNCTVLISQEQDEFGNVGKLERLNTCDIISSVEEEQFSNFTFIQDDNLLRVQSLNQINEVSIFDLTGRVFFRKSGINSSIFNLNIGAISNGIYILSGISDKGTYFEHKLIIQ